MNFTNYYFLYLILVNNYGFAQQIYNIIHIQLLSLLQTYLKFSYSYFKDRCFIETLSLFNFSVLLSAFLFVFVVRLFPFLSITSLQWIVCPCYSAKFTRCVYCNIDFFLWLSRIDRLCASFVWHQHNIIENPCIFLTIKYVSDK